MVLSRREKLLIVGLGGFLAVILVSVVISQFRGHRQQLERDIVTHTALLSKAKVLAADLAQSRPGPGGGRRITSLIGHIEKLAGEHSLKERLQMNRVPLDKNKGADGVDIKLDELNLDQVVSFLYLLENSRPPLVIDQLEVSPSFRKKNHLRISLRVLAQN